MNARWRSIAVVAAIFVAGVVTGSVGLTGWSRHQSETRLQVGHLQSALMEILNRELELTPEQAARVEPIVARACEDYRNLTLETVQRVSGMVQAANQRIARELTPEQAAKLERLEAERQKLVRERLNPETLKRDFLAE
jgi:Spy/CpxP family protein refolding chaperone